VSRIVLGIAVAVTVAVAAGGATIYSGFYNVGASTPHWAPTLWLLETARLHSIKAHAHGIEPPGDLAKTERIVAGASHYAGHCANCHAAPGSEADDMAEGMYPKPPSLTDVSKRFAPGELYWILKNGIKMTGMPSWGDHSDDDLWNAVAFLEALPGMTPDAYQRLKSAAEAAGGHHMHGGMEMPDEKHPEEPHQPHDDR
jgi:mono/diheme cytochrome c family protein